MDSYSDEMVSRGENHVQMQPESSALQEDEEAGIVKWRISKSHRGAHILRKLFSQSSLIMAARSLVILNLPYWACLEYMALKDEFW